MTGYSSGMRRHQITIINRMEAQAGVFGLDSSGVEWEDGPTVWAAVDWAKGMRTLNAGAVDAYAVKLVRMNYCCEVNVRSRVRWQEQVYQILSETFAADPQQNTIQFQMQLVVND